MDNLNQPYGQDLFRRGSGYDCLVRLLIDDQLHLLTSHKNKVTEENGKS